ncbi:hypothetical protein VR010_03315 [Actinomycetaceae bacterium L2_0104]
MDADKNRRGQCAVENGTNLMSIPAGSVHTVGFSPPGLWLQEPVTSLSGEMSWRWPPGAITRWE